MAVYVDLSKAFDTVNRNILLKKLQEVRVRGKIFDWFWTCPTDRKKYAAVDGMLSAMKIIESGISLWSNFRPLLLLLASCYTFKR